MMYRFIRIFILMSLLPSLCVSNAMGADSADVLEVKGVVVDANTRQPLSAVQISSISINRAVVTGPDGKFAFKAYDPDAVLMFNKTGYFMQKVDLYGRKELVVYLQDEMRTESYSDRADDVESVDVGRLSDAKTALSDALSGKFTGLRVTGKSGMPGEGSFLNFRGNRTLVGDNSPLVVIDGVPVIMDKNSSNIIYGYSSDILDPAILGNIDKVSFLTGADAMAYGSLGGNGVLMIETQRGKVSRTSVDFKTVEGVAIAGNQIPLLSGLDFSRYLADISGSGFADSEAISQAFPFLSGNMSAVDKVKYGFDSNWQEMIYRPAFQTDNMLKVRGGDEIVQYLVTAGYQTTDGVVDGTGRTKLYTGGNTNINFSNRLRAFASVSFDFIESKLHEQGLAPETNPMLASYSYSPITGVYEVDENGGIIKEFASVDPNMKISNPVSVLSNVEAKNKIYDFVVNLGIEYDFMKNLKADVKFGIFYRYVKDDIFIGGMNTNSIAPLLNGLALNTVRSGASESRNYFGKAGLRYDLSRKGHNLEASAGWQLLSSGWSASSGSGINTTTDLYRTLSNVSSIERRTGGYADALNWMNGYLKAAYNYKNQYFITAAGVVDMSSSYGRYSERCYFFPAVKAGWKADNAPFLRDNGHVSNLMLRAEYSVNPNGRYSNAFSSYYYNLKLLRDVSGLVRAGVPNETLGPESVHNFNVGLDFSLHGDKLSFSVDAYQEDVRDMIVAVEAPAAYGYDTMYKNVGGMRTRGIEAKISATLVDRGFYWRVGGNIGMYDSRITSLGGDRRQFINLGDGVVLVNELGKAPYSYYGFVADGVYSTSAEAADDGLRTTSGYAFTGGDMRFRSLNGDNVINDWDKTTLGNPDPLFYGGLYSRMTYKGFTLYADFSYSYGADLYNATRRFNESGLSFRNQAASMERRWMTEGQKTDIPRVEYGDPAGNSRFSSRWIEDGSYIRLKELTLSWETDRKVLFLSGLKVFVTGENLFCLTRYTGSDPEFAYSYDMSTIGMDLAKVPVPRFVKLGLILNL